MAVCLGLVALACCWLLRPCLPFLVGKGSLGLTSMLVKVRNMLRRSRF